MQTFELLHRVLFPLAFPAVAFAGAQREVAPQRFALVVAENTAGSPTLEALHYADDDGLRYARLLTTLGADVALLTVLDANTQRGNPGAAASTLPPTRAQLLESMAALNLKMQAARDRGEVVDFFFVFAGHGETGENGEGRMHLRDGPISRSELLSSVVGTSRATFNHLIIDACHAQSLVFNRGAAPEDEGFRPDDFGDVIKGYLARADLRSYPNTGAILASTSGRETHEWDAFEAGIFSHAVRSGLTGVADANGDGAIEYSELAAFVFAASESIPDRKSRPQTLFLAPEVNQNHPIISITEAKASLLRLPKGFLGRASLEDADGHRYADFNASGEAPVLLALGASPQYYLHHGPSEAVIRPARPGVVDSRQLDWRPTSRLSRGAVSEAFQRHLFGSAYGPNFYAGFVSVAGFVPALDRGPLVPAEEPTPLVAVLPAGQSARDLGPWPYVSASGALIAAATAGYFARSSQGQAEAFRREVNATGVDAPDHRAAFVSDTRFAYGFGVAALALGATTAALFLFDEGGSSAPVAVGLTPEQLVLGGSF